ncbi:hypothetical protein [Alkalilimnicola ehrlichii]|uniref:hypothetical protein n=1 Tax=Alkalilimnicola ehrlichii TaxID=351052 RepID=UPI002868FEC3|nr:hypothetical protein [Alkalilimnicola ehrlichii]
MLIFSNNFRNFKLAPEVEHEYAVSTISRATIPPDFARNPKIHHCFELRHR